MVRHRIGTSWLGTMFVVVLYDQDILVEATVNNFVVKGPIMRPQSTTFVAKGTSMASLLIT